MERVVIAGVGLIGGSFALALKKAGFRGEVVGVGSPRTLAIAMERQAIDRGAPLAEACKDAGLIYLAQPVGRIIGTLRELDPHVSPGALVTDAGSTKQVIMETAREYLKRCPFVGGHPIAGKESRGIENASPDLFRGAAYILTPSDPEELETPSAREFRSWIGKIGALERVMGADEHDHALAFSSHLPQLASTALASLLSVEEVIAGPGLAGATRLALSSYEIWRDILMTNTEPISEALTAYIQKLEHIRDNLRTRAMDSEFRAANQAASRIPR